MHQSTKCYYWLIWRGKIMCVYNKLQKAEKEKSQRIKIPHFARNDVNSMGWRYKIGWLRHTILYPLRTKILSFRLKGGICQIKINYYIRIHLFINYLLEYISCCVISYTQAVYHKYSGNITFITLQFQNKYSHISHGRNVLRKIPFKYEITRWFLCTCFVINICSCLSCGLFERLLRISGCL